MNILYEDQQVIVCVKPAGIASETRAIGQQDMVSLLRNYLKQKGEPTEIHLIHRLDQPVEGLMVFAKNAKAAASLSSQLAKGGFGKRYYAVIDNMDFPAQGLLEDYLLKEARGNQSKVVAASTKNAKKALLSYQVIAKKQDRQLLDIKLETGRHHQIRVQLSSRQAPIVGDSKYGGLKTGRPLALCSYHIAFKHPATGQQMEFTIKPEGEDFSFGF